jgi:hypothetical protein
MIKRASASRAPHIASQLKSADEILRLVSPIYQDIGGNPDKLVKVTPSYGGWLNALRFCLHRADGATTWVSREDLDSSNRRRLIQALKSFTHEPKAGCAPADVPGTSR